MNALITAMLPKLAKINAPCDVPRLMAALAMEESRGGFDKRPRFERAYFIGGRYHNPILTEHWQAGLQPEMSEPMARLCACSFGPWQVMFPVAVELGFNGSPLELASPPVNLRWATEYIAKRVRWPLAAVDEQGAVCEIADAYNTGSNRDHARNQGYEQGVLAHYHNPKLLALLAILPRP